MTLPVGAKVGPYEIVATLGAGGMGEAYRARDTQLNRDVAIKLLLSSYSSDPDRAWLRCFRLPELVQGWAARLCLGSRGKRRGAQDSNQRP